MFTILSLLLSLLVLFVSCLDDYYPQKYYFENSFMDSNTFTIGETHYEKNNSSLSMTDLKNNIASDKEKLLSLPFQEKISSIETSFFFYPEESHTAFGVLMVPEEFNLKNFGYFTGSSVNQIDSSEAIVISSSSDSTLEVNDYAEKYGFNINSFMKEDEKVSKKAILFFHSFNFPVLVVSSENLNLLDGVQNERIFLSVHMQTQINAKELNMLSNVSGYSSGFVTPSFDYFSHPLLYYVPLMGCLQPIESIVDVMAIAIEIAIIFGFLFSDYLQEKKEHDYYHSLILLGVPTSHIWAEKVIGKTFFVLLGSGLSLLLVYLSSVIYSSFTGFFFFANYSSVLLVFLAPLVLIIAEMVMETFIIKQIRV